MPLTKHAELWILTKTKRNPNVRASVRATMLPAKPMIFPATKKLTTANPPLPMAKARARELRVISALTNRATTTTTLTVKGVTTITEAITTVRTISPVHDPIIRVTKV